MAITRSKSMHQVRNFACGSFLDDAGTPEAMVIVCGFLPRYVRVVNETDRTQTEWFEGMADTNTLKQAQNGDGSLATDTAILVAHPGFTFLKALTIQNKQYRWIAIG